jgi:dihydroorotate dehydrogenase
MPLAIGVFEAQVDKISKETAALFFEYEKEGFADALLGNKTNQMRTVPLNVKIDPEFHVSNYDDITKDH